MVLQQDREIAVWGWAEVSGPSYIPLIIILKLRDFPDNEEGFYLLVESAESS
jgi:hypothetical protein